MCFCGWQITLSGHRRLRDCVNTVYCGPSAAILVVLQNGECPETNLKERLEKFTLDFTLKIHQSVFSLA